MHVKRVQLLNIRGFEVVDLDLTRPDGTLPGWTVLAGRNGSGKSTLLKAIALSVAGPIVARSLVGSFSDWVRTGTNEAGAVTHVVPSREDNPEGLSEPDPGWLSLSWSRPTGEGEPELDDVFAGFGEMFNPNPWSTWDTGWFLVGYGPYRRLTGHASDAQRLMAGPARISRLVSLFREDASLVESVQWLREIYLRRLENKPGAAGLEKVVVSFLNDGLLPGGVFVERIDSEALWVNQHGVRLPLAELSDGYRTTAALVMDIVRHLHQTFGDLRIEQAVDDKGPYQRIPHPGIVLVDEIDLHLHVSWQKGIGFWLKRHFPNIQFIVTTHSPFVCQAADPKGLIRLPAPGENRQVEHVSEDLYNTVVNGSADDAVLTELFGLETPYSAESEKLRDEVARIEAGLQTGKATTQDEQRLEELRSRLPQTPGANIEQLLRKLTADA